MATLTVWKFTEADAAQRALSTLEDLQRQQLITVQDGAVVSWPEGEKKPKTTQLHYPIFAAIERRRPDALEVLLNAHLRLSRNDGDLKVAQQFLGDAQATQDKRLVALVERYIESLEQQSSKSDSQSIDQSSKNGKKWWPFSTRTEKKVEKAKDSSSPADGSGSAMSWLPLSKTTKG